MNFSNKTWNILNSIGIFFILGIAVLLYEQRGGLYGGLRNVWEFMLWMLIFIMMFCFVALFSWITYRYSRQSANSKITGMRFTYIMLVWSVITILAVQFFPGGVF
ncbi:MAG TPA: hypothetical protein VK177_14510 [Flavobacteriales bacterium]|nr:hypothetical protein [Flavobacteriales bacterium]